MKAVGQTVAMQVQGVRKVETEVVEEYGLVPMMLMMERSEKRKKRYFAVLGRLGRMAREHTWAG